MTHTEALDIATRTARCVSRDPEALSLAGIMALRALATYDGTVSEAGWVRFITRRAVKDYLRRKARRREVQVDQSKWERMAWVVDTASVFDKLPREDLQLVHEYWELRWPLDVMARRHWVTVYRMRKMLEEVKGKLQEALDDA